MNKQLKKLDEIKSATPESGLSHNIVLSALEEDLLTLLCGKSLYGLQIMDAINDLSCGRRTLRPGSLYTTLHRLEQKDLISAQWGDDEDGKTGGARRKYYSVTSLGSEVLQETQSYRQRLAEGP